MVKTLRRIARFYHAESCGQCTPCREGTGWLHRVLTRIVDGKGTKADIDMLVDVANKIEGHTICALGDAAAWPVQSFIKHFRHEFEYMVENKGGASSTTCRRWPHEHAGADRAAARGPPADPNVVNVEVNGVPLKARKGQMIIEVTDRATSTCRGSAITRSSRSRRIAACAWSRSRRRRSRCRPARRRSPRA